MPHSLIVLTFLLQPLRQMLLISNPLLVHLELHLVLEFGHFLLKSLVDAHLNNT